jgi:hypothetical protein
MSSQLGRVEKPKLECTSLLVRFSSKFKPDASAIGIAEARKHRQFPMPMHQKKS